MECILTFPLDAFRVGCRDRGLAREIGKGLLPDNVRLRETRGAQAADQRAWFAVRAKDYHIALNDLRGSALCREIFDLNSIEQTLGELSAGGGSADAAFGLHRAFDTGMFAMEYERGDFWATVVSIVDKFRDIPGIPGAIGARLPSSR